MFKSQECRADPGKAWALDIGSSLVIDLLTLNLSPSSNGVFRRGRLETRILRMRPHVPVILGPASEVQ